jgi:hypothetical protein
MNRMRKKASHSRRGFLKTAAAVGAGLVLTGCEEQKRPPSLPVPRLQLAGFNRIRLAPGEQQTVAFTLTPAQMSFAGEDGQWVLEPGAFRVWVGGGQPAWQTGVKPYAGLEGSFTVKG